MNFCRLLKYPNLWYPLSCWRDNMYVKTPMCSDIFLSRQWATEKSIWNSMNIQPWVHKKWSTPEILQPKKLTFKVISYNSHSTALSHCLQNTNSYLLHVYVVCTWVFFTVQPIFASSLCTMPLKPQDHISKADLGLLVDSLWFTIFLAQIQILVQSNTYWWFMSRWWGHLSTYLGLWARVSTPPLV